MPTTLSSISSPTIRRRTHSACGPLGTERNHEHDHEVVEPQTISSRPWGRCRRRTIPQLRCRTRGEGKRDQVCPSEAAHRVLYTLWVPDESMVPRQVPWAADASRLYGDPDARPAGTLCEQAFDGPRHPSH